MLKRLFLVPALSLVVAVAACIPVYAQSTASAPAIDLVTLSSIFGSGGVPALIVIALISFVAKLFCAVTDTPHPDTRWGRIYQGIELLALITRNTKRTGIPAVDALYAASTGIDALKSPASSSAGSGASTAAKIGALLALVFVGLSCSACVKPTGDVAADLKASQAKFIADTATFNAAAGQALANFQAGAQALQPTVAAVCGAISMGNGLFKVIAPIAGADPAALATEATVMVGAEIACAHSQDPTAPSLATDLGTAVQAYAAVKQQLAAVAPDVAAAAGATTPTPSAN